MAGSKQLSQSMDSESEITLGLLNAINENSALTQRSLARDLGIALGLANAYLKRCAKKGLVKVAQVPSNRYAYYLTPQGFSEKSRLTAEYFSQSFKFFRTARAQCSELFALCAERGWHDVVLVGASDLGEIAVFCAREHGVRVTGIVDGSANTANTAIFAGLTVWRDMAILVRVDAALVTDLSDPQATFEATLRHLPDERILTPRFLKISRRSSRNRV
jgi:DNA-binding MarR family transcriptional regulator